MYTIMWWESEEDMDMDGCIERELRRCLQNFVIDILKDVDCWEGGDKEDGLVYESSSDSDSSQTSVEGSQGGKEMKE